MTSSVSAESNPVQHGSSRRKDEKISDTLRGRNPQTSGSDEIVQVIIQLNSSPTGRLNALLQRNGVHLKDDFRELNSFSVELPLSVVSELADFGEVEFISEDRDVHLLGHVERTTGAAYMRTQSGNSGLKGKDVNIAVLDSGIDKEHHQIGSRIEAQFDFTGEGRVDDPFGHGTHVASLAAGVDHVARGAYTGVAPEAKVINLRVLNSRGVGAVSNVLKALNWILAPTDPNKPLGEKNYQKYRIKVVNLSLGAPAVDSYKDDPLCLAARRLVNTGLVVVAAAGNDGTDVTGRKIYGRIHAPGNEPSVITVGAANSFGTDTRADDGVTTYSSRGPTRSYRTINGVRYYDHIIKPDLIAPGNKLISAEGKANQLILEYPQLECTPSSGSNHKMMRMSGTSMATPLVSGAVSLILQANPKLTPNLVKMILMYTAQPLAGYNMFEQGAGQLNVEGAIRLAKLIRTDLSNLTLMGSNLLITSVPACHQLRKWQQHSLSTRDLVMSVNLSGKQLMQPDLIERIEEVLHESQINPWHLKLEITETVVMENPELAAVTLAKLRGLGVRLSIDDFGTGYSSLSYLNRFPVDTLKIDRSFVTSMKADENIQIVKTIITLAGNLGMQVVAEGVETEEQLELLRSLKCQYGQGFYFSKGLEVSEADFFILSNTQVDFKIEPEITFVSSEFLV